MTLFIYMLDTALDALHHSIVPPNSPVCNYFEIYPRGRGIDDWIDL